MFHVKLNYVFPYNLELWLSDMLDEKYEFI
jgi:hypothetical protein